MTEYHVSYVDDDVPLVLQIGLYVGQLKGDILGDRVDPSHLIILSEKLQIVVLKHLLILNKLLFISLNKGQKELGKLYGIWRDLGLGYGTDFGRMFCLFF